MLVISQLKIIKMINSSTKSHWYVVHLTYSHFMSRVVRSRVTKWNVFYTTLVSCMVGVI